MMNCKGLLQLIIFLFKIQKMEWNQMLYGDKNKLTPSPRWGHRLLLINNNEIVLFGGFGGSAAEGKYLDDLWLFSTKDYTWNIVQTTGQAPEKRSNYSIHYSEQTNQIILFGGGSQNSKRFNTVSILNWEAKEWRQQQPNEQDPSPWERTYHSSQFHYPYLIIHGGESVTNLDLDDMWIYNIITKKWVRINFDGEVAPRSRRFHCTALIGSYFYVVGGCTGNYMLLGDIFRVNLKQLFQNGVTNGFNWSCVVKRNRLIERWGHSSSVIDQRLIISGGRINAWTDTSELISFDSSDSSIKQIKVMGEDSPKGRRRHSSIIFGKYLLFFGGFNGSYLNDFYYIEIKDSTPSFKKSIKTIYTQKNLFNQKFTSQYAKSNNNISIVIYQAGGNISKIESRRQIIEQNAFFKNMISYGSQNVQELSITLPYFCDSTVFKMIHHILVASEAMVSVQLSICMINSILKSLEYFLCQDYNFICEQLLLKKLNYQNCLQILQISSAFKLANAQKQAGELYLSQRKNNRDNKNTQQTISSLTSIHKQTQLSSESNIYLSHLYEFLRLDIDQRTIKEGRMGFIGKMKKNLKQLFSRNSRGEQTAITEEHKVDREERQQSCWSKIGTFFSFVNNRRRVGIVTFQ